jgi:hypothetical protein
MLLYLFLATASTDISSWAELKTACGADVINVTLSPTFQMGIICKPDEESSDHIDFSGKDLTIWGNNATLDGCAKNRGSFGRFFYADSSKGSSSLEFHNLILQNGQTLEGATCRVSGKDCSIVTDCPSGDWCAGICDGGAIFVNGSIPMSIVDCSFINNVEGISGGAIYATNGAILTVERSVFIGNGEYMASGGAIFAGADTVVEIHKSVFNNNTADGKSDAQSVGGAICAVAVRGLKIYDSTFSFNFGFHDGAIHVHTGVCPSCPTAEIHNCTFEGNEAVSPGGAMGIENSTVLLAGCFFTPGGASPGGDGINDMSRDETSNATFACPAGLEGAPVRMTELTLSNPPPASLKCTATTTYSCDSLTGICKSDKSGVFPSKQACSSGCTAQPTPAPCQVPRNCGQHNTSVVCGHTFTGCEFVCGNGSDPGTVGCCHHTILTDQICNQCVEQLCKPPPPLPPPVTTKYACITTPNYHCIEYASGTFSSATECEKGCQQPPSSSTAAHGPFA